MRPEDLFDGITQIRDDLVEQAAPQKRSGRKKIWIGVLAAALALAVGAGALWYGDAGDRVWKSLVASFNPGALPTHSDQSGPTTSDDSRAVPPWPAPGFGTHGYSIYAQTVQSERPMDRLGETVRGYAVALAAYPEQALCPYSSSREEQRDPESQAQAQKQWQADSNARQAALADYNGELDGFFSAVMEQFLSDGEGENRVISPVNLYLALAMLAEVTDGDSRQQVLDLIGAESVEQLRQQAGQVWRGVYQDDGASTLILGSSLWMDQDIEFVQETMDTLARDYFVSSFRGEMGSAEFDQALQEWIDTMTGGLLHEQAGQLKMEPETVLALASTIYFKASWMDRFREKDTTKDIFHSPSGDVERDFMHTADTDLYYWGDRFTAVYRHLIEEGGMWLILPDEGVRAEQLLTDPQVMRMMQNRERWENCQNMTIHQSIPKFDVVSDLDLRQGLQELGVTDIFNYMVSDFTPMTTQAESLYLGKAQHTARVKIDEEGCEAAAYTLAMVYASGAFVPAKEVYFTLDRPFLFVITSEVGELPLFAGIVNQP